MKELIVSLWGVPSVLKDGQAVHFPFKQAEALLYYLLVEHEVSRNKIADLIWGDNLDEQKIKSNMRNAIYVLRKIFSPDFLIEPRKNILQINPEVEIRLDIDRLKDKSVIHLDAYSGDFLQEFYLKDNEYYNEWIESTRRELKQVYSQRLKQSIEHHFDHQNWSQCELEAQRLIALDEYDETGYYYLMNICRMRGEHHKVISLYEHLKNLLAEDLFQFPGEKISQLTEQARRERSQKILTTAPQPFVLQQEAAAQERAPIYGRAKEKELLEKNALHFFNSGASISQVVMGEAGIGKTTLLNYLCEGLQLKSDTFLFRASCYHAEESFTLKPWQAIFEQILHSIKKRSANTQDAYLEKMAGLFFPHLAASASDSLEQDPIGPQVRDGYERTMTHTLLRFAKNRKVIVCLDDLQWADTMTVSLIQDILTTNQNRNILFILGCRSERHANVSRFLEDMSLARFLEEISLERFTFADTVGLADLLLPQRFESTGLRQQLYHETEGNPFFIIETINNFKYNGDLADITQNMRGTIRQRTMLLPAESRSILDVLSLFFDGVSFQFLMDLSLKEEDELINILELLMAKQLICEKDSPKGTFFHFTHQKILEFVYSELSLTKRRVFHERIGVCLERKLTGMGRDFPLYYKLMYHFERAQNQKKYLKYYIKYVYNKLNQAHEYYPVISDGQWFTSAFDLDSTVADDNSVAKTLQRISQQVEENEEDFDLSERRDYLSDYYHMMGRYYIRVANYERGLSYIQTLIQINQPIENEQCRKNLIKANRQLICVYMNRYEPEPMKALVRESVRLLEGHSKPEEMAIWTRLYGISDIMSGDLKASEQHFTRAIGVFEQSAEQERYCYNLAASYAGLGEVRRLSMDYAGAFACYDRATAVCKDYCLGGGATFYTYAGQAALDSGDLDRAERYLGQAVECFNKTELLWERSIAFSHYGLLCLLQKRYPEALAHLDTAKRCSKQLGSCYEQGVLNRMYAWIAARMRTEPDLYAAFASHLNEEPQVYIKLARKLLEHVYSPIDQAYLNEIEQMI